MALGLRDNRTIHSAYLERVSQRYALVVARGAFVPKLNIAASDAATTTGSIGGATSTVASTATWLAPTGAILQFSWARNETSASESGSVETETTTVSLTQPLLKGGGFKVTLAPLRIAELEEQINRLSLKSTVINTVTSIILDYRALQQTQEQLSLSKDALARSQDLLQTNRTLIQAGRMAQSDLVQTQSDAATQEVNVLQAQQACNTARLQLLALLALDLRSNVVASDKIEARHQTVDLDRAVADGLDNRADLLSQRKAVAVDRQSLIVAKNNRLWGLSAVANYQNQRSSSSAAGTQITEGFGTSGAFVPGSSGSIGLQLTIPLGDYTLKQGEIDATTNLRVAEVQLEDLEEQVEESIRDASQAVDLSWAQLSAAQSATHFAELTLSNERAKLAAGRSSNFEVLSFEDNLRTAQITELNASISYLNSLTSLDQQLGTTLSTWRIDLND